MEVVVVLNTPKRSAGIRFVCFTSQFFNFSSIVCGRVCVLPGIKESAAQQQATEWHQLATTIQAHDEDQRNKLNVLVSEVLVSHAEPPPTKERRRRWYSAIASSSRQPSGPSKKPTIKIQSLLNFYCLHIHCALHHGGIAKCHLCMRGTSPHHPCLGRNEYVFFHLHVN